MSVKFKMEGGGDIERALAGFARGTAKGISRRSIKKVLKPVAKTAEANSDGKFKVAVTSKLTKAQARQARADRGSSKVTLYVGPVQKDGSHAPHAHLYEDGTAPRYHKKNGKFIGAMPANPFMRPAWDLYQPGMLKNLGELVWLEIEKSVERAARKAAKAAR